MSFLVVLLAFLLQRFFDVEFFLKRKVVFNIYFSSVGRLIPVNWQKQHYGIFLMMLPALSISMGLQLINSYLGSTSQTFFSEVLVLLYCLGPSNLYHQFLKIPTHLFEKTHNNLLTVLFWFVLLGPSGAVLFRLTEQLASMSNNTSPERVSDHIKIMAIPLAGCLSWLPTRFFIGIQSIVGQFPETMRYWLDHLLTGWQNNALMAEYSGRLAVNAPVEEETLSVHQYRDALWLIDQTLVIFLGMLLLYTVLFWALESNTLFMMFS